MNEASYMADKHFKEISNKRHYLLFYYLFMTLIFSREFVKERELVCMNLESQESKIENGCRSIGASNILVISEVTVRELLRNEKGY